MFCLPVTAGIIFVLIKKRKWDRLKQCEERLIDYQLTSGTGYSSKLNSRSVTPEDYQVYYPMASPQPAPPPTSTMVATDPAAYPYYPQAQAQAQAQTGGQQDRPAIGHRARGMSAPASTTLSTLTPGQPQPQTRGQVVTPESPPPAYQTLHARYDPSRYSQVSTRFSSLFEGPRSSTGTVAGNPNRNTRGYTVSGMLPTTPESSSWFQQQQQQPYQYQPGPAVSGSASDWTSSSGAATTTTTVSSNSNNASGDSTSEERGPRRPRPVLSRLITNL